MCNGCIECSLSNQKRRREHLPRARLFIQPPGARAKQAGVVLKQNSQSGSGGQASTTEKYAY